ncbi:PRC-barrel domain-containing protein [Streptomyces sp. 2112.3]|uniref:PRC-barrel domain-containing protein n=1 Tax=Streptomyces sp. 2112.3 TaxID=1881023 RepID=UPI00089CA1CE|nr:PRC-barrel domain-containing protein [Streptomyces sp. 2112.3]
MEAPLDGAPGSLTGLHVVDADGAKVGKVQQVYRDDATNDPEWITVRTGLFGMKETFIPLAGVRRSGDDLHVPHAKETIKAAPRIDADGHLDPSEEDELYRHYGMARPGTARPRDPSGPGGTADPGSGRAPDPGSGTPHPDDTPGG